MILNCWRREDSKASLLAYCILLIWCFPLVVAPDFRGPPDIDWEWFLAYFQALRTTLLDYHQFPGFNPWMYLGTPLWANPQIGPITHFTPLVLIFGPVVGMKLGIVASYLISFACGRALGRSLFKNPLAAVIAGLLYALNTGLAAHWVLGHVCFSAYPWAPLLILYCLRLPTHKWAGAWAGAIAGLMIQYGVHYYVLYIFLLSGLLALYVAAKNRALIKTMQFGGFYILAIAGVAASRLIPMLEVMGDYPRKLWLPFALNAEALWQMFFVPALGPVQVVLTIHVPQKVYQLTSTEFFAYIGVSVLCLALVSLRWGLRFFHVGALLSFLLLLGTYQPWHLSKWLATIRPFDSMWVISRWRLVLLACFAYAAATTIDHLLEWTKQDASGAWRKLVKLLVWVAPLELVVFLLPSWVVHVAPYRDEVITRQQLGLPQTPQMIALKRLQLQKTKTRLYFAPFRANIGIRDGYDPLFGYIPAESARTYWGEPGYRGEYLLDGQPVLPTHWSPNRLVFDRLEPGKTLTINLNPGRGWSLNGAPIFQKFRVMELQRSFKLTVPPTGQVNLRYLPPGFLVGLFLSLASCLILGGLWFFTNRRSAKHLTPIKSLAGHEPYPDQVH